MSSLGQRILPRLTAQSLQLQSVRHRGKINIQKPRAPHYERARILAATKPVYPRPAFDVNCDKALEKRSTKEELDNPYHHIIARDVRNYLATSKLVVLFHLNSISAEDNFEATVAFHKHGIAFKAYGRKVLQVALEGTKYDVLMPLFQARTAWVFSPEDRTQLVLRISRKVSQIVPLCAILEDRVLSVSELVAYSELPDLTTCRAQFAGLLNTVGGRLVQNLEAHQTSLVRLLDARARGEGGESK